MVMNLARWLVVLGCIVALATAALHGSGYKGVTGAIHAVDAKPFLVAAVSALWLMFSAHLVILALVAALAAWTPGAGRIVALVALLPAVDTVLLARFVGAFIGTFLVAAVAVLFFAGGLLLARRNGA